MSNLSEVIIGLRIFEAHGGDYVCAEHDEIFAGQAEGVALSQEEISQLYEAGWRHASEFCPCPRPARDNEAHEPTCNQWRKFV